MRTRSGALTGATVLFRSHPLRPLVERLCRRWPLTPDDQLALYSLPQTPRRYEPRETVVREGSRPTQSCALVSGVVSRDKCVGSGARQIVALHFRGEFVDLHNSLLPRADHDVVTLTPVEMLLVPREAVEGLVRARPQVGLAMWRDTLVDAAVQREWTSNIGRRGAMARVAHLLCEIVLRLEAAGLARRDGFDLPVTQEALADCVGLTAVHLNRILRILQRHGLERLGKRRYQVTDWAALAEAGDFSPDYLHLGGEEWPGAARAKAS